MPRNPNRRIWGDVMNWLARVKTCLSRLTTVIEFCHDCGREQPVVWTADDALWAKLADGSNPLCPECFDKRAQRRGIFLRWVPMVESH